MKRLSVILITFLSLFLGGVEIYAVDFLHDQTDAFIIAKLSGTINAGSQSTLGREMCLLAVGGNAFAGNTTSQGSSIRPTQAGRRSNPSTKTSFKIVKAGKVIDGRGYVFRGFSVFRLSPDYFSFNRHLHLMGILRL